MNRKGGRAEGETNPSDLPPDQSTLRKTELPILVEADPVLLQPAMHLHPLLAELSPHGGHVPAVPVQEIAQLGLGRWRAPRAGGLGGAPFERNDPRGAHAR